MKDTIIFWFNNPPKVGKGAFNYVANNWGAEVIYVFLNDFRQERKKANWDDGDFGAAKIINLFEFTDKNAEIEKIFNLYKSAIHIVNGFISPIAKMITPHLYKANNKRVIYMTERPVQMGSPFERFLREVYYSIKYRRIHAKLKQVTAGVLALGQLGVDTYKKYGWDNNLLYPFMYCPPLKPLDKKDLQFKTTGHIKFLYVGRFYYKTKGTDVLLDAAEKLNGDFTVDFVGGYGKNKDEVISRIEKSANMHYLGTWPSNEVGAKMQDYDAIVIPTKYDGWNLLVNEAVNAGTPIIVTDGAVSDEVVSRYKCGIVIPHSNVKSLRLAMQTVVDNPNSLLEYQDNSKVAKSKINESVVGSYLIDIIKHCIYKSETRPVCPWHH